MSIRLPPANFAGSLRRSCSRESPSWRLPKLRGAERQFVKVTEMAFENLDGFIPSRCQYWNLHV